MLPASEYDHRQSALVERLRELKLDVLLVTHLPNIRYLCGFSGSSAVLLIGPEEQTLFTDPRYAIQAVEQAHCRTKIVRGRLLEGVVEPIRRAQFRTIGFERNTIAYATYEFLNEQLPAACTLQPTRELVETLRMVKSPAEISLIRQAVNTTSTAFEKALRSLKPNMSEARFAAELDYQMRRAGAERAAFETIVASGPRSALPHASPTDNPIVRNQLLLIDMGAMQHGYASDMTRTLFLGKPSTQWRRTYQALLEAQLAAICSLRPGIRASTPDRIARNVLKSHKLHTGFTHSTGHGLGLEIHEAPRLAIKESTVLEPGMVVTIEPGVYFHASGGIRIEDTVLITPSGCEVLTPTSKQLLCL